MQITVDCDSSPCMNGGTCMDKLIGPDQRVSLHSKTGAEEGRRDPLQRSFSCNCRAGYYGRTCDFEVDYCESVPCLAGSTCQSLTEAQDFACLCKPGFTGRHCDVDIDECALGPCRNGATCLDGLANATCVCTDGWTGTDCSADVDECARDPGVCLSGGACVNTPGAYHCDCPQFYLGLPFLPSPT